MTANRIKAFGKYSQLCHGDEAITDKHNIEALSIQRKDYKFKFSLKQFGTLHSRYHKQNWFTI